MQSHVYILHSKKLNKFYVGFTTISVGERLQRHLTKFYEEAQTFTRKADDWMLVWQIQCSSAEQGRNIEGHIKNMKSSKYIQNLIKYPEMRQGLFARY
jgi:putative endonuclease